MTTCVAKLEKRQRDRVRCPDVEEPDGPGDQLK